MRYKALSLRQPWPNLIADGSKTIETRTWATRYRGELLIVSSKKPATPGPAGCAICLVELVDCRPFRREDVQAAQCEWYEGYAWVLENVRRVKPVPIRGRLHIYDVDVELELLDTPPTEPRVTVGSPIRDEAPAPRRGGHDWRCIFCGEPAPDWAVDHIPAEVLGRARGFTYTRCERHRSAPREDAVPYALRLTAPGLKE